MKVVRPVKHTRPMGASSGVPQIKNDMARAAIWAFFRQNQDRAIVKVAFITVRVRDLRILFELMAGPEPQ